MGYVFLQRERVARYAGSVILVAWSGAEGARRSVVRDQPAALALANELQEQLKTSPEFFAEFASKQSDSPRAAKSGDMGLLFRGTIDASFSEAFEALEEGNFTQAPVETRYGYYIIKRNKVP